MRNTVHSVNILPAGQLCPDQTPTTYVAGVSSCLEAFVLVPESLDNLVTTTEAAQHCGVGKSTISMWRERGHLRVSGLDERGFPLYKLIDVLRAARDTRQRSVGSRRTA